jgi:hypothetical protein
LKKRKKRGEIASRDENHKEKVIRHKKGKSETVRMQEVLVVEEEGRLEILVVRGDVHSLPRSRVIAINAKVAVPPGVEDPVGVKDKLLSRLLGKREWSERGEDGALVIGRGAADVEEGDDLVQGLLGHSLAVADEFVLIPGTKLGELEDLHWLWWCGERMSGNESRKGANNHWE